MSLTELVLKYLVQKVNILVTLKTLRILISANTNLGYPKKQ